MNQKTLTIVLCAAAVILAAVAAIVVNVKRADTAQSYAEARIAEADRAAAEAKEARATADAEAERRRTAEAEAKRRSAAAEEAKESREKAALDRKTAEDNRAIAEAEARRVEAEAETARARRDEARLAAETARNEKEKAERQAAAEQAKAETELSKLQSQRMKDERIIAEAKLLELRKIDFETFERELIDWKHELDERERALKPEKTIVDLAWAGGEEDSVIDENGNISKQAKSASLPEDDPSLPKETRNLAKANREVSEDMGRRLDEVKSAVLDSLERAYAQALKDGRVIDADYYRKGIRSMYPDWKFKGEP